MYILAPQCRKAGGGQAHVDPGAEAADAAGKGQAGGGMLGDVAEQDQREVAACGLAFDAQRQKVGVPRDGILERRWEVPVELPRESVLKCKCKCCAAACSGDDLGPAANFQRPAAVEDGGAAMGVEDYFGVAWWRGDLGVPHTRDDGWFGARIDRDAGVDAGLAEGG